MVEHEADERLWVAREGCEDSAPLLLDVAARVRGQLLLHQQHGARRPPERALRLLHLWRPPDDFGEEAGVLGAVLDGALRVDVLQAHVLGCPRLRLPHARDVGLAPLHHVMKLQARDVPAPPVDVPVLVEDDAPLGVDAVRVADDAVHARLPELGENVEHVVVEHLVQRGQPVPAPLAGAERHAHVVVQVQHVLPGDEVAHLPALLDLPLRGLGSNVIQEPLQRVPRETRGLSVHGELLAEAAGLEEVPQLLLLVQHGAAVPQGDLDPL
mmetsp:Transcript_7637/g.19109  ORF Transcript_7637/g.19109 Transcript_7637/m.19109 type:complete len:269 (-) Transcript_7637:504-1310(-)